MLLLNQRTKPQLQTLLIQISDRLISNQRANHSYFPPLPFQQDDCLLIIKRMCRIFWRIAQYNYITLYK